MSRKKGKKGTKTSSFGVGKREQHDSSKFYNSKLYKNIKVNEVTKEIENVISSEYIDSLLCKDSVLQNHLVLNSFSLSKLMAKCGSLHIFKVFFNHL